MGSKLQKWALAIAKYGIHDAKNGILQAQFKKWDPRSKGIEKKKVCADSASVNTEDIWELLVWVPLLSL